MLLKVKTWPEKSPIFVHDVAVEFGADRVPAPLSICKPLFIKSMAELALGALFLAGGGFWAVFCGGWLAILYNSSKQFAISGVLSVKPKVLHCSAESKRSCLC